MQTTARVIAVCFAGLPIAAMADTFTDGFDLNHNVGGWTINGNPTIDAAGGNPGYWLHNALADTFYPIVRTDGVSPFVGDFRDMDVTTISFDAVLVDYDFASLPDDMKIELAQRQLKDEGIVTLHTKK